jgi:hypothetical protein
LDVFNRFSIFSVEEFDQMDLPSPNSESNVLLSSVSSPVGPENMTGPYKIDSVSSSIYQDPESHLLIPVKLFDNQVAVETHLLVDGGATSLFIDKTFAEQHGFPLL